MNKRNGGTEDGQPEQMGPPTLDGPLSVPPFLLFNPVDVFP
jgi:hypothetical protein